MKKIMLLGGNSNQKVAIERAKQMGYYTILCDYLYDNPGQYVADKTYFVSTTDKEAVLDVAKKEQIDGVISYASDVAAPTAAYVAEKLNLPGNPYKSVMSLCNKDLFREFLRKNGFATPHSVVWADGEENLLGIESLKLPVIVKPVDSSSSKGSTVINNWNKLNDAIRFALSFSRCKKVIIEEYIVMKHQYLIGGDIFVLNGEIVLWGLMNCHRDDRVNSLVPVGKSFPLLISAEDEKKVKDTLQNLVNILSLNNTAMNVELVIDKTGEVYLIDVGPRCGGNNIPEFLNYVFGLDEIEMFIKTTMGETINLNGHKGLENYCTHNLHSTKDGTLKNISFSEELESHIFKKYYFKEQGDIIEYFDNATKALGIIFMRFNSMEEMFEMYNRIYENIFIEME